MGNKYQISARLNGYCMFDTDGKSTESFIVAIFYLIKFRIKYPIVDLKIRNGYIKCRDCDDDDCPCRGGNK